MSIRNVHGVSVEQIRLFEVVLVVRRRRGENITMHELIAEYCQRIVMTRQKELDNLEDLEKILLVNKTSL